MEVSQFQNFFIVRGSRESQRDFLFFKTNDFLFNKWFVIFDKINLTKFLEGMKMEHSY